ncbi:MAG: DNA polymerase I [Candidatus Omnitrophota bacterium]|jgi:DNA polymerase-1
MSDKRLYLIDATAFCYRAFYALPGLTTSSGQPTNAVYGFLNILNKVLKEKKPQYLAVCFDVSRKTFRSKKFAEYKIQRQPMPDDLISQIPLIKELVSAYGLPLFEKEGFEADDIIATLAKSAKAEGLLVTIVSNDKDILQLVDDKVEVFSPYKDTGVIYDIEKVRERFDVSPGQIADIIALMGDSVDNIPGVKGVGEKTASSLIAQFGSVEKLLEHPEKIKQDKLKSLILENIEMIKLNRELAVLYADVDIEFSLDKIKIGRPDTKALYRIFKALEFRKLLKEFSPEQGFEPAAAVKLKEDELIILAEEIKNYNKGILKDPKVKKIGHDLKKIKVSLGQEGVAFEGLYFDIMIAAYLLNPSRMSYSLEDVAFDYLNASPMAAPDSKAAENIIARLKPVLEKELIEKDLFKLFCELEMPLVGVLSEMELYGIKIDTDLLKDLSSQLEKRLIKLIEGVYDLSGTQFNINSPKQLREILFERLKLPVIKKTKTGPSTDEEVLNRLAHKHKLPALLLEYRQLTKLKNTYIDALPALIDKRTGRIHTSFNQTGTETGRLSSSNPNLQNIPVKTDIGRNIRKAIVAEGKDYYLISSDYSQVELRILAHLSRDEKLITAFREDKDIHKATAASLYDVGEPEVDDSMRETAKRVNFGLIYGQTSYGLSRDLKISPPDAQNFIDAYFIKYPRVREYINAQIATAEERGFVTTILGRRRYLPEINNKNANIRAFAQRQAVNTPIQGSAADMIKLAMIRIQDEIRANNLKSRLVMQIHDELVFEAPKDELKELTCLVRLKMENVFKLNVPIRVDIKQGRNWLEMEAVR